MSIRLLPDLFSQGLGVGVGTMGLVYQQTVLQLAHRAGPSCLGLNDVAGSGASRKIGEARLCLPSWERKAGGQRGLGAFHSSVGNEMTAGGRAVILKPKGRSTFPESLLCGGLPSTAKAARTLAGLAGRSPEGGTPSAAAVRLSHGTGRWVLLIAGTQGW